MAMASDYSISDSYSFLFPFFSSSDDSVSHPVLPSGSAEAYAFVPTTSAGAAPVSFANSGLSQEALLAAATATATAAAAAAANATLNTHGSSKSNSGAGGCSAPAAAPSARQAVSSPSSSSSSSGSSPVSSGPTTAPTLIPSLMPLSTPTPATPSSSLYNPGSPGNYSSSSSPEQPVSGGGGSNLDPLTVKELIEERHLKKRRLARKAELARKSRKRKKEYIHELEAQVHQLTSKINALERQAAANQAVQQVAPTLEAKFQAEQLSIQASLKHLVTAPQLNVTDQDVSFLVDKFLENVKKVQLNVDEHLNKAQTALAPGVHMKFILWAVTQDVNELANPASKFYQLLKHQLGLSDQQIQTLLSKRAYLTRVADTVKDMDHAMARVRAQVSTFLNSVHHAMDDLAGVLTPLQLARFYVWADDQRCNDFVRS